MLTSNAETLSSGTVDVLAEIRRLLAGGEDTVARMPPPPSTAAPPRPARAQALAGLPPAAWAAEPGATPEDEDWPPRLPNPTLAAAEAETSSPEAAADRQWHATAQTPISPGAPDDGLVGGNMDQSTDAPARDPAAGQSPPQTWLSGEGADPSDTGIGVVASSDEGRPLPFGEPLRLGADARVDTALSSAGSPAQPGGDEAGDDIVDDEPPPTLMFRRDRRTGLLPRQTVDMPCDASPCADGNTCDGAEAKGVAALVGAECSEPLSGWADTATDTKAPDDPVVGQAGLASDAGDENAPHLAAPHASAGDGFAPEDAAPDAVSQQDMDPPHDDGCEAATLTQPLLGEDTTARDHLASTHASAEGPGLDAASPIMKHSAINPLPPETATVALVQRLVREEVARVLASMLSALNPTPRPPDE